MSASDDSKSLNWGNVKSFLLHRKEQEVYKKLLFNLFKLLDVEGSLIPKREEAEKLDSEIRGINTEDAKKARSHIQTQLVSALVVERQYGHKLAESLREIKDDMELLNEGSTFQAVGRCKLVGANKEIVPYEVYINKDLSAYMLSIYVDGSGDDPIKVVIRESKILSVKNILDSVVIQMPLGGTFLKMWNEEDN